MHIEIRDFFVRMKMVCGAAFNAKRVLECGSYDINGNPRNYFKSAKEYIGIDWREGPCVDKVSLVHEYRDRPNGYFDFVIATSLFEHDPHWRASLMRMVDLLAPDGSILITCGGLGFLQHELETSPGFARGAQTSESGVYYGNLTQAELLASLVKLGRFRRIFAEDDPKLKDLRVFATGLLHPMAGVENGIDPRSGLALSKTVAS